MVQLGVSTPRAGRRSRFVREHPMRGVARRHSELADGFVGELGTTRARWHERPAVAVHRHPRSATVSLPNLWAGETPTDRSSDVRERERGRGSFGTIGELPGARHLPLPRFLGTATSGRPEARTTTPAPSRPRLLAPVAGSGGPAPRRRSEPRRNGPRGDGGGALREPPPSIGRVTRRKSPPRARSSELSQRPLPLRECARGLGTQHRPGRAAAARARSRLRPRCRCRRSGRRCRGDRPARRGRGYLRPGQRTRGRGRRRATAAADGVGWALALRVRPTAAVGARSGRPAERGRRCRGARLPPLGRNRTGPRREVRRQRRSRRTTTRDRGRAD